MSSKSNKFEQSQAKSSEFERSQNEVKQAHKASQSDSRESILTCSMASMKDDVSEQDSGLDINEVQGLKEENQELKLENAKLHTERFAMGKKIEDQKAKIAERENELQLLSQFDDHSTMLALQVQELFETRTALEEELALKGKQLEQLDAKSTEMIKDMENNHNKEMEKEAIKVEKLKELVVMLKRDNAELMEELTQKDLQMEAKKTESEASLQAIRKNFEEEIERVGKEKENMLVELTNLKEKVNDETAKIEENGKELAAIEEKCELIANTKSILTVKLQEISKARGRLENELVLKCKELRDIKSLCDEEMKKVKDEHDAEMARKALKIENLEQEIKKCHEDYDTIKKTLEDKELEVQLKEMVKEAIFAAMESTYTVDTEKYQKTIEEMEIKMSDAEDWRIAQLEKERLMTIEIENIKQELMVLQKAKDDSEKGNRSLVCKIDDLIAQKEERNAEFLAELERLKNINNALKDELERVENTCARFKESNSNAEKLADDLKTQLRSERNRVTELDKELVLLSETLSEKEAKIDQLFNAKLKKRGIRRFISCGR